MLSRAWIIPECGENGVKCQFPRLSFGVRAISIAFNIRWYEISEVDMVFLLNDEEITQMFYGVQLKSLSMVISDVTQATESCGCIHIAAQPGAVVDRFDNLLKRSSVFWTMAFLIALLDRGTIAKKPRYQPCGVGCFVSIC